MPWLVRLGILALGLCCAAPREARADLFDALFGRQKRVAVDPGTNFMRYRETQRRPAASRKTKSKGKAKATAVAVAPVEAPKYYEFTAEAMARVDFRPLQTQSQKTDGKQRVSCRFDAIDHEDGARKDPASNELPSAIRVIYDCSALTGRGKSTRHD